MLQGLLKLLKTAGKVGPYAVVFAKWAWPKVKDNQEVLNQLRVLLERLAVPGDRSRRGLDEHVEMTLAEAKRLVDEPSSQRTKEDAEEWARRLHGLRSAARVLPASDPKTRRQHRRKIKRGLAEVQREMLAAAIGVSTVEAPPVEDNSDAPSQHEDQIAG